LCLESMGEFKKAQREAEMELREFEKQLIERKFTQAERKLKMNKVFHQLTLQSSLKQLYLKTDS